MEVIPRSGVNSVGESNCPEQESNAPLKCDGKSDCVEDVVPVKAAELKVDDIMLDVGRPLEERKGGDQFILQGVPASERFCNGDGYYDSDADRQNLSSDSYNFADDNLDKQGDLGGSNPVSEKSQFAVDTAESGLHSKNQEGESSHSEIHLEQDEPVAVWVKWRGKWQPGIKCARVDWPLSTLKAKPTHDRKQYIVIFFPRTRNYSWADVQLVCPISEFPQPIAYKTHKVGAKAVKDLTLAHRFIMQKLAVGMLNILDQLNREGLEETAREVMVLKEFSMEASRCKGYSDLGRMLVKLQHMILQHCLSSNWLQYSQQSWVHRCQDASSAECIEMLKDELSDSIIWDEVNSLANAAAPVEPASEWKSWKHDVMKWFSISHPISTGGGSEQPINDSPPTMELQTNRKRPKLEVRRADTHASHVDIQNSHQAVPVEIDSSFFNGRDVVNTISLGSVPPKQEISTEDAALAGSSDCVANKWDNIVVEAGNMEVIQSKDVEMNLVNVTQKSLDPGSHNRQCAAFIESKGRQCVRYASEGDVYCCVHLASRFVGNSAKGEVTPSADPPMCEGTTVLGTKCKHRALIGTSFCKKHRPHSSKGMNPPDNRLKRRHDESFMSSEIKYPTKIVHAGKVEAPAQVDPSSLMRKGSLNESSLGQMPVQPQEENKSDEMVHCIGSSSEPCLESPIRHSLYCDTHLPSWLKRARNGKSRIVSKEVFIELLKYCCSREQKLHLHQACELFYRLFKSILSLRNPVPKEVQFQWAISEASKDIRIGEFLMKLVRSEKERLKKLWRFSDNQNVQASSVEESVSNPIPVCNDKDEDSQNVIRCKICSDKFLDDQALGTHWMGSHKKEAQWLFRGYVCAICLDSFTNKKVLETHVQERHHVQFVEQCMLLQCIPCASHFGNPEQLWLHVLSVHASNLKLSNAAAKQDQGSWQRVEPKMSDPVENINSENHSGLRRYTCRFCGLKFDLLPDLGRHHQAAHMGPTSVGPHLAKKGIQFYAQKLKSGRLTRPRFKKGLNSASYRIRNRSVQNLKKRVQASFSISPAEITVNSNAAEAANLGRLVDTQCLAVAKLLFSEIKKTEPRPTNSEILLIARSACCKLSLQASLETKYGILPERIYLKAAKLCSEHNIPVEWHKESFICPKECTPIERPPLPSLAVHSSDNIVKTRNAVASNLLTNEWTMDESHCVIDSRHFTQDLAERNIILCDDISFGQESVPIACVVDESLLNADGSDGQITEYSFPWESFTYITKPLHDQSLILEAESSQLGCACAYSRCSSEMCDHVYVFDNDYEDAKDIYGKPMHGRFPYDERGRIILEEGYLIYECNQRCCCSKTCQNRVLQNGVQVKLEIFKTEKKGWAVRAREAILRGSFVCEYIGEVIDEQEANDRLNSRYDNKSCRYFYEINAHIDDVSRLIEGQVPYVIDATNYGNISRFINHSCSPNLVNYQVLVESMDSHLAHIGLYAIRDIAVGEELTYDFRYLLLPGEGCPCLCGSSNCRGRLY
ncbi:histone-lysine N-methyltransferase SUVR5 [Olea europaea subsp. europaea]|uniref:Histone-lysine N-methyltransferase SUVR5 n=1 Tax=Olea europaea subsp. europaea TaxID=158383 RepID=A0A8S0PJQ9_OLEEU|nr:histone-lysine N-methyltransferase SUVR5 [Olea europaea subsp. europaea]